MIDKDFTLRHLTLQQAAFVLLCATAEGQLTSDNVEKLQAEDEAPDNAGLEYLLEKGLVVRRTTEQSAFWAQGPQAAAVVPRLAAALQNATPAGSWFACLANLHASKSLKDALDMLFCLYEAPMPFIVKETLLLACTLFTLRRTKEAPEATALDSCYLALVSGILSITFSTSQSLRPGLQLMHAAYRAARRSGNARLIANLALASLFLQLYRRNHPVNFLQKLKNDSFKIKELFDGNAESLACIFDGMLAFANGDLAGVVSCYNRSADTLPWYYRGYYSMFCGLVLFNANYLQLNRFVSSSLDALRHAARQRNEVVQQGFLDVIQCFYLLRQRKTQRVREVLEGVQGCDSCRKNIALQDLAARSHALSFFLEGDIPKARHVAELHTRDSERRKLGVLFRDPLILDMLFSFEYEARDTVPFEGFGPVLRRALHGSNIHLRGAALRIHALRRLNAGSCTPDEALSMMRQSLNHARRAGDAHQCLLTACLLAELCDQCGNTEEARSLRSIIEEGAGRVFDAGTPYHLLSAGCLTASPGILRYFARTDGQREDVHALARCQRALRSGIKDESASERHHTLLAAIAEGFDLERCALFRIQDGKPRFVHGFNFSGFELASPHMQPLNAWLSETARSHGGKNVHLHRLHGVCLVLEPGIGGPWLLYMDAFTGQGLQETLVEDLHSAAHLFMAELRGMLLLERREASSAQAQHAHLHDFIAGEDRNHFLVPSHGLAQLLERARSAASTDASILLWGETGVGKEVMARHIHQISGRKGPFVAVHPAGMAEGLFESEFFGHERGAFTGAVKQKIGLFELAAGGTLFIDEIGEMPLTTQTKLLRVLQEHRFMRVGGTREIISHFRMLAATNRDLWEEVRLGRFREDLLYRIAVMPIRLSPLRERIQDIRPLAEAFCRFFSQRYGKPIPPLPETQKRLLEEYSWPGNVRELKNLIERAMILYDGNGPLCLEFSNRPQTSAEAEPSGQTLAEPSGQALYEGLPSLPQLEERYLRHVLALTGGRVRGGDGAASLLGVKAPTLYAKLRRYGIPCRKQ